MPTRRKKKLKKNAILALFSCCILLSGTEIIQRSANSDIESIVVEKDNLIIKSKGKTYIFKFSELLKTKNTGAKNPSPQNIKEAFKYNGEWCFFTIPKSKNNRLKYIKELRYNVFVEGELLERVLYKGKYYARDLNKKIYEPHWEVKKDFSLRLVNAKQYFERLNIREKTLKKTIQKLEQKIPSDKKTIKADREKYIIFLKNNSIITKVDNDGNTIGSQGSGLPTAKLRRQLRIYNKNIRNSEKQLKRSIRRLASFKSQLRRLQRLQCQTKSLYILHSSHPTLKNKIKNLKPSGESRAGSATQIKNVTNLE